MSARTKLILVAGARPNFMKVAPVIRELRKNEDVFEWKLVHTGQHYDHGMSDVFFTELGIPDPDYHMGAGGGTHAEQTARIMLAFEKYCLEEMPDLIVVFGDVNSTLACSIVAKKLGHKVAHVEAGLRSGDMRMPEEVNRIVTDSISDLLFVTEPSGLSNLRKEGHQEDEVHFVGHVMVDNLFYQTRKLETLDPTSFPTFALKIRLRRYGVVTLHRPSNVDECGVLSEILQALGDIATEVPLIFPIHPRTEANMSRFGLRLPDNVVRTAPLPYMEFLNLWKDAAVILTDSGGLQEESTALGIPCVTLRENTERPVTVTQGTNVIAGTSRQSIVKATMEVLLLRDEGRKACKPELWDGNAAVRIVGLLKSHLLGS